MNTGKMSLAILVTVVSVLLSACGTSGAFIPSTATPIQPTTTPIPPTITFTPTPVSPVSISGTITNLNDVKQYLSEKSFLQLVRVSDDGKMSWVEKYGENGISIGSDLAQISIPYNDGYFEFRIDTIAPGKYFISAQKFIPPNGMRFNGMVIANEADKPESIIIIEIPDNITLPYHLDMGKVVIVLP